MEFDTKRRLLRILLSRNEAATKCALVVRLRLVRSLGVAKPPNPIRKSTPVTDSERRLRELCEGTFLSLWSYPSVFNNKGFEQKRQGQELCDLLVVFEQHVLIFSDKACAFDDTLDVELAWGRWFTHAVLGGARQLRGAERWLRQYPDRVFVDRTCRQRFPVNLPSPDAAVYHLIAVAHGATEAAQKVLGGSGGLVVTNEIPPERLREKPFTSGDLDPSRTFIHVFDDASLPVAMKALDTISDFVEYLSAKADLIRGRRPLLARAEEDLIAIYLSHPNEEGRRSLPVFDDDAGMFVDEGQWEDLVRSPEWERVCELDELSYAWDKLIESFAKHTLNDTRFFVYPHDDFNSSETILRFLAREPRVRRRTLARSWLEALVNSEEGMRYTRWLAPESDDLPYYVFLFFPRLNQLPYETYREVRGKALEACCRAVKLKWPNATDIIGIATESGLNHTNRAEDAMYLDARIWNAEEERLTRDLASSLNLMQDATFRPIVEQAYNETPPVFMEKLRASIFESPCPCGRPRAFEDCHAGNLGSRGSEFR